MKVNAKGRNMGKSKTFRVLFQEDGKIIRVKNTGGAFHVKDFVVQIQIPSGKAYPSNEKVEQLLIPCFQKYYSNHYILFKITGRNGMSFLSPEAAILEKYGTLDVSDAIRRKYYQEKQERNLDLLEIHGFVVLKR